MALELETFKDAFDAMDRPEREIYHLKVRYQMIEDITETFLRSGLTQKAAAEKAGITQPRFSHLLKGRIDLFSTDALFDISYALGTPLRAVRDESLTEAA